MRTRVLIAIVFLAAGLSAQPVLRLKSGRVPPDWLQAEPASRAKSVMLRGAAEGTGRVHLVVQFREEPGETQRQWLERQGAKVLAYVPDQAWLISAPVGLRLEGAGLAFAGALEMDDKLSALLSWHQPWEEALAVVEWQPDVTEDEARLVLASVGAGALENPDVRRGQTLLRARTEQLRELASRDETLYIFPAADELARAVPVAACLSGYAGQLPGASNLAESFGDGWDGPGQGEASLGYWIGATPPSVTGEAAQSEIRRAMDEWASAVRVRFMPVSGANQARSIDVFFASGEHGDNYAFDGRAGALAHAFYPPPNPETLAGDLHMDMAEPWRIGGDTDVFSVALHELGHTLGLGHNDDSSSVMYPYYRRYGGLSSVDREAIRRIYRTSEPGAGDGGAGAPLPPPIFPLPGLIPGGGAGGGEGPSTPEAPGGTPTLPTLPPTQPPAEPPSTPEVPPGTPPAPPAADRTAPALSLTSPASTSVSTSQASIVVRGVATDNSGAVTVTWETAMGESGVATGAAPFATPEIPLAYGSNRITIRATDAAGNMAWRSVVATRR